MSTLKLSKEQRTTKQYYESHAQEWARRHADPFHDEKEFRALLKLIPTRATVVDIGCATGVLVPLFLGIGKGISYFGIDIVHRFIKIAQSRYPHLRFVQGNIADKTTLPQRRFDAFIARSVLMHLPYAEWDSAFSNIECLVKEAGYGYVVLPENRPPSIAQHNDPRHFTLLSQNEQKTYMKSRGWKIVKAYTHSDELGKARWCRYIVQLP